MSKEMTSKEAFNEYKQVATWFSQGEFDNYSPYIKLGNDLLALAPVIDKALTELEELKSWRDELNETIQDLISKAKHWEEKENKTDFEKGIARGYKTMLHQLLVGIDFDKEEMK